MKKKAVIILAILGLLSFVLLFACNRKGKPASGAQVRISSTGAYNSYFGPAPTTDKGTCFAFVIYFPSAKHAGEVVPFPFFSFDEESLKKVSVERFLGGMDVGSYAGEFLHPFPAGTHVLGISVKEGTALVNFSKEILAAKEDAGTGKAALAALTLTLTQFPEVKALQVQVEGKDVNEFLGYALPKDRLLHPDPSAVEPPGPPRLLSLTAVRDKGEKSVDEVNAYFDRPVEVQELKMTDPAGTPFAGELFHSVFDMAAVLKPKDPALFKEKMPIKVRWKVTDKVGRQAEGDSVWPLEVKEH
ncbi:GerMN domain-containing protein [Geomesophilobacter sediminis]|uniref:GerMN domain-containing protein n=1 Tax=Geomesophilobacter sediminis TaxID=2798584 RepID=A0A8J7M339_9BACT|nr:GerMN domain-containing protein [Geomesophilobacter sediminis]MBJ6727644.1 GerMN domain-containing protein [Geomesophilobacter sediminis]